MNLWSSINFRGFIMKKILLYVVLSFGFLLVGCNQDIGTSSYTANQAGEVNRVVPATVVSMRAVTINTSSGYGAPIGAVAGGVAGSAIGGSTRANIIGGLGGAVVGGLAGHAIDQGIGKKKGMEYVLRVTKDKSLITVTQLQDMQLSVGQKVLVIYGKQTRVVPDDGSSGT